MLPSGSVLYGINASPLLTLLTVPRGNARSQAAGSCAVGIASLSERGQMCQLLTTHQRTRLDERGGLAGSAQVAGFNDFGPRQLCLWAMRG